jgi:hypothetical protein
MKSKKEIEDRLKESKENESSWKDNHYNGIYYQAYTQALEWVLKLDK